jgi:hypothetical protein
MISKIFLCSQWKNFFFLSFLNCYFMTGRRKIWCRLRIQFKKHVLAIMVKRYARKTWYFFQGIISKIFFFPTVKYFFFLSFLNCYFMTGRRKIWCRLRIHFKIHVLTIILKSYQWKYRYFSQIFSKIFFTEIFHVC